MPECSAKRTNMLEQRSQRDLMIDKCGCEVVSQGQDRNDVGVGKAAYVVMCPRDSFRVLVCATVEHLVADLGSARRPRVRGLA